MEHPAPPPAVLPQPSPASLADGSGESESRGGTEVPANGQDTADGRGRGTAAPAEPELPLVMGGSVAASTGGGAGSPSLGAALAPPAPKRPLPPLAPVEPPKRGRKKTVQRHSLPSSGPGEHPAGAEVAGAPTASVLSLAESSRDSVLGGLEEELVDERAREVQRLQTELEIARDQYSQQRKRIHQTTNLLQQSRKAVSGLVVQIAKVESAEERERISTASYKYGRCRFVAGECKSWDGGYEAEDITRLKEQIRCCRQSIQEFRKQLVKKGRTKENAVNGTGDDIPASGEKEQDEEVWESREISTCRMSFLTREENLLKEREQRLQVDRELHFKQLHLMEIASRSNFNDYRLLADQYQLLNMIGKGGFSEVYRAFDLESGNFVAVKIHELGKDMTDGQRQSYIKRAMRELEIQKSLKHPRVVSLLNCFAISTLAFGTVLELVEGSTLDHYMRLHAPIGEREARGIVIQIFSGLRYMNTNGRKIIHYDLKPGNLFYHCGEIRITDFGLSKRVDKENCMSIDNTSQGAGTYWYLPPECMVDLGRSEAEGAAGKKISNKVDVWSTGVILFELLFNRRPFGHGQSQESLRRAANAASQLFYVEFPTQPKVVGDAKDFVRRLLAYRREERPDVMEAFNDPYLRSRSRPQAATAAARPGDLSAANAGGELQQP